MADIKLSDNRINRVASNEGFLSTINPNTFSSVWQGTIQTGQQLQRLGEKAGEFFAKQKAIENDNYVNNQLLDFENL